MCSILDGGYKVMINFEGKIAVIVIIITTLLCACANHSNTNSSESKTQQTEQHDIVIIGGGISGLTCGYFLKNKDFIILEKNNVVGGRAISGLHNLFTYAKGAEYLGKPESPLSQMIDELKLVPKEIPSPMDASFDGSNFYYGSEGIKKYLINNSNYDAYKKFTNLLLNEYKNYDDIPNLDYSDKTKSLDNITAGQWLKNNEISEAYVKKYNVASKGLFGATLDEISALSLIPEAAFDYEGDTNDQQDTQDSNQNADEQYSDAKKEHSCSYTFVKGLTELTNKLSEVLNNKIRLNSTVVRITKEGNNYLVVYVGKNGKESTVIAKKVVLAVPAPTAIKIAPTVISKDKTAIMDQIKYSSYATVALFSKEPIFDKAFDLAVPDGYFFTDIYDSTWVEKYYDSKKKLTDHIMSVYVAPKNYSDHSLDKMSDQELIKNVYNDLDKVFPSASSKITGYDIERFPYAYPVMTLGAYQRLLNLNEINHGSLILAGDYLVYPTFEGAVQSGYLAAKKISDNN